jgi:hypothetical protein
LLLFFRYYVAPATKLSLPADQPNAHMSVCYGKDRTRAGRLYRRVFSTPGRLVRMAPLSTDTKIGTSLALFASLGAGVMFVAPTWTWVGWVMIVVSLLGFFLLALHHCKVDLRSLSWRQGRRKVFDAVGLMVLCIGLFSGIPSTVNSDRRPAGLSSPTTDQTHTSPPSNVSNGETLKTPPVCKSHISHIYSYDNGSDGIRIDGVPVDVCMEDLNSHSNKGVGVNIITRPTNRQSAPPQSPTPQSPPEKR